MDDVARRQVVGGRDLGAAGRLGMTLLAHEARAFEAQLDAGERVDGVVDAVVQRRPAAGHAVVGGVDDRVYRQGGDVAAPQAQPRIKRGGGGGPDGGDARLGDESLQQLVLGSQQIVVGGSRFAYVDECAEGQP